MSRANTFKLLTSRLPALGATHPAGFANRVGNVNLTKRFCSIRHRMPNAVPIRTFTIAQYLRKSHHHKTSRNHEKQQDQDDETDSDSDDEDHYSHTRGESEFWRRKMRTIHRILDVNKDGVIAFDDMRIFGDRFVKLGHLSATHSKDFHNVLRTMWEEHFGSVDQYNLISIHQYLDIMHHSLNDPKLRKKVHHFLPYLFKAVDKDGDGIISLDEFKLFFNCLGLPSEAAVVAFSVIDENTDNKLSLREFVKLGREYYLTENQKLPSKVLWGPLAD